MTDHISNTAFVEVLDPIPLENIGWEVHAVSPLDWVTKVAVFPYWKEMTFTKPVSDPGYGKLTVSAADERLQTDVAGYPLEDQEVLLQVYDEGVLRFDFLASKAARPEDKPDVITLDGKGTAQVLERAIALPDNFPVSMATTRTFTDTRMGVWLTLLAEAQDRGVIPQFLVSFDGVNDTAGMAWPPAETFDVNVGDNLYDMLTQFCELYNATWVMRPGFHLDIYQIHGNDRREEVIWHLGGHTIEHTYERDRSAIGTNVYSGTDGIVAAASDLAAETRWGKREAWVSSGDAKDSSAVARYATRNLELLKDQKKVRTVTVPWKAPNRRVFVDWAPGDICAIETTRDGVVAIKITAVSVQVDENAHTTIEIVISDDPTAAMPFEAKVAQQQARDGSRATSTRASKKPSTTGTVTAGTGITGGGSTGGPGTTVGIDVEWFQDQVAAMATAGSGVLVSYDDVTGHITFSGDLEWIQDQMASFLVAGSGVGIIYNDAGNALTISADLEYFQDQIASFLVAGSGISLSYNDAGNQLTIAASLEYIQDQVAAMLVAGTDINLTYNDGAGTLTIDSTASGGGGGGGGGRPPLDSTTLHATYGDDFTAGTLDAKWTRRNLTSSDDSIDTSDYGCLITNIPNGSPAGRGYLQMAPAGDFSIILSLVIWGTNNSANSMFGPMVIDSSGNGIGFSPYDDEKAYIWNLSSYEYGSTGASMWWTAKDHFAGQPHWLRIRKSGTTYYASASRDGRRWSPEISGTWGGTVDRIGFGKFYNAGVLMTTMVDRFNVV